MYLIKDIICAIINYLFMKYNNKIFLNFLNERIKRTSEPVNFQLCFYKTGINRDVYAVYFISYSQWCSIV